MRRRSRTRVAALVGDVARESVERQRRLGGTRFGRSDGRGLTGKVERVAVGAALDGLVVAQQGLLKPRHLALVPRQRARLDSACHALRRGHADGLSFHGARRHHPRGGESHVAGADVAAGHEEIRNVPAVERAQRDVVDLGRADGSVGRQVRPVETLGRMRVHGPSANGYGILETSAHQVLLRQNVIARQPAAAAPPGHHPDPVHGPVFAIGAIAAVLDVVPHAEHDGEQLEADPLVVSDNVMVSAPFNPPVAVLPGIDGTAEQLLLADLARPFGGRERHGVVVQAGGKQDARSQRQTIGLFGRERLAELGARLPSGAHLGAGFQAQTAIPRAVAENPGADAVDVFALIAAGRDFGDASAANGGRAQRGFEQQRNVRLTDHLVVEQEVPKLPTALRVVDRVGEPQLLDQPALAPARPPGVLIRADHVHLHFARRIAAEPRTVLQQDDAGAMPRCRNRRADAGQAAARHHHVGFQIHQPQVRFGGGERCLRRRNSAEIGTRGLALLRGGALRGRFRQHDQGIAAESGPCEKIPSVQYGPLRHSIPAASVEGLGVE